MTVKTLREGIVLRAVSGVYSVQEHDATDILPSMPLNISPLNAGEGGDRHVIHCTLRGNLKKELHYSTSSSFAKRVTKAKRQHVTDTISVGDRVRYVEAKQGAGVIEEILPRRSQFSRVGFRGQEHTLVCNLDQIAVVFACAEPRPDPWKLDRFLAATEAEGLSALIVANKADLVDAEDIANTFAEWTSIGYPMIATSAQTGQGVEELRALLKDKVSAFVGPSGAGKSSLLNTIQPGLNLKTGDIGYVTYKGKHTTTAAQLIPLRFGGWVADTPGLRQLDLKEMEREDLLECFPELRGYVGQCRFDNCRHDREPGCALKTAAETGQIAPRRLESFLTLAGEVAKG